MTLVAAALTALVLAPTASAGQPERLSFVWDDEFVVSDLCAFPVTFSTHQEWRGINRWDSDGNPLGAEFTVTGRDSFTAAETLVSELYTFHLALLDDETGAPIKYTVAGVTEKIRLPDGSLFVAAGWFTWLDKPFDYFGLNPDRGSSGDIEAFCAALG